MANQYGENKFVAGVPTFGMMRKSYTSPTLLEYGNVAKLTQGNNGSTMDSVNGSMNALSAPRDRNAPAKMR